MNYLTIYFAKNTGKFVPLSWLIRWFQKSDYSHIILKFRSDSLDRDLYYDASGQGLNFKNQHEVFSHYEITDSFALEMTREQNILSLQWCIDNLHIKYGYAQIAYLALERVGKKLGIKVPFFVKNRRKRMICNEVGYYLLKDVLGDEIEINPDATDLNWLYAYLVKREVKITSKML